MTESSLKDWLDLYEGGKHRRYGLLFAVNGGAFAIAKLLVGEGGDPGVVLGGLTLPGLALGMALFSVVMVSDIYLFGMRMRQRLNDLGETGLFGVPGRIVLLLIGVLLVAGWLMAGFGKAPA